MDVYGLQVAQGEIDAQVADGQVNFSPLDIAVNEGRLTVKPRRAAGARRRRTRAGRRSAADRRSLVARDLRQGMKFVTPILAESTVADGRFSMVLDGGWVPLFNPDGRRRLGTHCHPCVCQTRSHRAAVCRAAAEVDRHLAAKARCPGSTTKAERVLSIDDSNVEFRMVGGRVYHRGLQFMAGTVPVSTYGSVGLDESVAIMAEIPLKATLFGRDLSFGTMEGQVLQIPIDGTLAQTPARPPHLGPIDRQDAAKHRSRRVDRWRWPHPRALLPGQAPSTR